MLPIKTCHGNLFSCLETLNQVLSFYVLTAFISDACESRRPRDVDGEYLVFVQQLRSSLPRPAHLITGDR